MVVTLLENTLKVLLLMTHIIINRKCTHLIVQIIPYIIIYEIHIMMIYMNSNYISPYKLYHQDAYEC